MEPPYFFSAASRPFSLSALAPKTLETIHTLVDVVFLLAGGSVVVVVGVHFSCNSTDVLEVRSSFVVKRLL
jgi:hypothetical protein